MKIDLKFYICSIFIDLGKAFDAVSRDVLLNKWNYHGDRANRGFRFFYDIQGKYNNNLTTRVINNFIS